MTISWIKQAENADAMARANREAAAMLPMRTHGRKMAFQCAQFCERQAAFYREKAAQQETLR